MQLLTIFILGLGVYFICRHTPVADWYHNRIWHPLLRAGADKYLHFIGLNQLTRAMINDYPLWSILTATIGVSILKELLDYQEKRGFDWKDLIANGLGILMGFIN